jgi:hypothetical protein
MMKAVIQRDFWEKAAASWGKPLLVKQKEQEERIQKTAAKSIAAVMKSLEKYNTKKNLGTAFEAIWDDGNDDEFI